MNGEIGIEITHRFENLIWLNQEFQTILDIVRWKRKPFFPSRGRMAWYILEKPPLLKGFSNSLVAVKIKGVGGYNPPSDARNRDPIHSQESYEPFKPTTTPLSSFATYPHLGFKENGQFSLVFGNVAPVGGILHDRALCEYNCALHLLNKGIPAIVPVAVIRYDASLLFNNQRMGVAICLSPSKYPYRLSEVQFGSALKRGENTLKDEYYDHILNSFEIFGDPESEETRLEVLNKIAKKVGQRIHDFSSSGLYRYSAELPNFEFDISRCEVILTDLDSSAFLRDLPQPIQRLQVLRDMASMIYHFLAKFATPLALGKYTLRNLLKFDPITELICGYFPMAPRQDIRSVSRKLWNFFIPHFMLLNKNREKIRDEWSTERRRSYKMDHDLFFILAMIALYPIFSKDNLSKLYPDDSLTQEEMIARAKNFLGERFEYMIYLLNESLDEMQWKIMKGKSQKFANV